MNKNKNLIVKNRISYKNLIVKNIKTSNGKSKTT